MYFFDRVYSKLNKFYLIFNKVKTSKNCKSIE